MKSRGTLQTSAGIIWLRFSDARESYGAVVASCECIDMPPRARAVFHEHEQRVLNQELSLLHHLQEEIHTYGLQVAWDGEPERTEAFNVQLCEGEVSFRTSPLASQ